MDDRQFRVWACALFGATAGAAVVFTLWPGIDLAVSAWFFRAGEGFWLGKLRSINLVREAIRIMMSVTPLIALVMLALAVFGVRLLAIPAKLWGYIFLLFLIGPALLANVVFKNNWGRARPEDITEFGGSAQFTPALQWTSECDTNCSFVSGEGAGATALAISFALLIPFLLPGMAQKRRRKVLLAALIVPATAIVLRIVMGRHFLSDTVFAILLVLAVGLGLFRLMMGRATQVKSGGR